MDTINETVTATTETVSDVLENTGETIATVTSATRHLNPLVCGAVVAGVAVGVVGYYGVKYACNKWAQFSTLRAEKKAAAAETADMPETAAEPAAA